jgi:DNA-binding NarL/FixJ family response regulator
MKPEIIRVVLAEDHARVRKAIRNLLEKSDDILVVGEASDGPQALQLAEELSPDLLLLDVEMPGMNGDQVAAKLRESGSSVHILVLSAYDDKQYILGMLNSGVSGYLTKEEVPETLVKAVHGIAHGEVGWVSQRVADQIASWAQRKEERPTLTKRELTVLKLVIDKNSDQEIAEKLGLNESIVERHITLLCTKLKASSRVELAVRAKQQNLF